MAAPNLDDNAGNPAAVHTPSGMVRQHSLKDQIDYDQYAAAKLAATKNARRGIMLSKTKLGGPIGYTNSNSEE